MGELKVFGPDGKVIPPKEAVKAIPTVQEAPAVQTLFQIDLIQSSEGPRYGIKALQPTNLLEVIKILSMLIGSLISQIQKQASNIVI